MIGGSSILADVVIMAGIFLTAFIGVSTFIVLIWAYLHWLLGHVLYNKARIVMTGAGHGLKEGSRVSIFGNNKGQYIVTKIDALGFRVVRCKKKHFPDGYIETYPLPFKE